MALISTIADDALGDSDTYDLVQRLRRRDVSPAEAAAAARERIARANLSLNAVVRDVDGPWDRAGALAGIPTVIKDNEELAGYPLTWGSRALGERPMTRTSPFASHLMQLGLVLMAKTTMPEFGLTATTESLRNGPTRNPWGTYASTGGSSGGSAALVAAGAVTIAHANDGGGSIRIPAACCGLVGLKPSRGRLIDIPELDRAPVNIPVQGVLTRTVRDTALFYAEAERLYANPALPPIGHVERPLDRPLRMALVLKGVRGIPFSDGVMRTAEGAALLCERLGHHVELVEDSYPDTWAPDFLRYWALVAWTFKRLGGRMLGADFDPRRTEPFTNGLAAEMGRHAVALPGSIRRLRSLSRRGTNLERSFDVVICPTVGHETPRIGWFGPDVPFRKHLVRLIRYAFVTPMQNVTGGTAISLPLGRTAEGLPIGVQFSAPAGQERLLLELALQLEAAAPWPRTPPTG